MLELEELMWLLELTARLEDTAADETCTGGVVPPPPEPQPTTRLTAHAQTAKDNNADDLITTPNILLL